MYGTNIVALFYVIKNITNSIITFIILYQKKYIYNVYYFK